MGRQKLLDVSGALVEDHEEGLLVEAGNLRVDGLHVGHLVAFRQLKVGGHCRPRRRIVERGPNLRGDESATM